jgi:hypothetical protein
MSTAKLTYARGRESRIIEKYWIRETQKIVSNFHCRINFSRGREEGSIGFSLQF